MAIENFNDRLFTLLNGFTRNAATKEYLTQFVTRNAVSIDALIENDMFGTLSNFDAANPAPSILNQVSILKAYILNEPTFENYVVADIVQPLNGYINDAESRARNLDNSLLMAQWRRVYSWDETHYGNPTQTVQQIDRLQTLNKMARMLDTIEEDSDIKKDLNAWIAGRATQLLGESLGSNGLAGRVAIFGAPQFSQFLRKFIDSAIKTYNIIRAGITDIAQSPFSARSIFVSLKVAVALSLFLGTCALLPLSILLTASQEIAYFTQRMTRMLISAVLPASNNPASPLAVLRGGIIHGVSFVALIAAFGLAFNLSATLGYPITVRFILGLQIFPASWSWELIGTGFLAIAATEFALGTLWFCGQQARNLWRGQPQQVALEPIVDQAVIEADPELQAALAASLEANPEPSAAPGANMEPAVGEVVPEVDREPALNDAQRERLQRLLMHERAKYQPRSDEAVAIENELRSARNTATPYYLTERARAVIVQAGTIPNEFAGIVRPSMGT